MELENLKALTRWTLPASYGGAHWDEYFVFLGQNRDSDSLTRSNFICVGQNRDSDSLTRSNFICGLEALGGESETVIVVREGHWACGWVEWIAIHESDTAALEQADSIACALEDYPVVNEDHWSEMEWNEAADYWERMRVRDRIEYCERAGISIFAARRDYLPQDDSGALLELLRG